MRVIIIVVTVLVTLCVQGQPDIRIMMTRVSDSGNAPIRVQSEPVFSTQNVVGTIPQGVSVEVLQERVVSQFGGSDTWFLIRRAETRGWVLQSSLVRPAEASPEPVPTSEGHWVRVLRGVESHLRPQPNSSTTLALIPAGTPLRVEGQQTVSSGGTMRFTVTWYQVSYQGHAGWVSEHDVQVVSR